MSSGYSAHPELASEQLQNAENANKTTKLSATTTTKSQRYSPQHRRNNNKTTETAKMSTRENSNNAGETTSRRGFFNFSPFKTKAKNAELAITNTLEKTMPPTPTRATPPQKTLPVRTRRNSFPIAGDDNSNYDDVDDGEVENNTKDCVDYAATSISHDQLQHRLSRTRQNSFYQNNCDKSADMKDTTIIKNSPLPAFSDGCPSGLSSAISSPSPSTVSSPLSTPTRLTTQLQHSHQHCCRKSSLTPGANTTHHQHHQLHHHHHQHQQHHNHDLSAASSATTAAAASGCKKLQKFDPRFGPSPYRQLLPIILCILSFATVFTILIVYMDTTEIRHQQFRLNMTRDYDLYGVAQDDPVLVAFLREIQMRKYSLHFLKNRGDPTAAAAVASASVASASASTTGALNFTAHHDGLVPEMAHYVADLLGGKMNGAVIQSLSGTFGQLITAPWLVETLNWAGIIIEPEPRRYFTLLKQNSQRPHLQVLHACVSPNPYPKEVTIHNEETEVRINSLLDEETSWFNSRVKCFPLYTIMLAYNRVEYDLLSLGVHGHELEILQTLPFDKIKIEVISIHLQDNFYKTPITQFLKEKSYKLVKEFGSNYFYKRINTTSRTRKKDILLLKTP